MRTFTGLSLLVQVLSLPFRHHPEHHLEPVPISCDEQEVQQASQAALKSIAFHQHHGYKYKLNKMASSKLQKTNDTNCEFHLELELEETTCHVVNPKPLEECEVRRTEETKVESNCNVVVTVLHGNATAVRYTCKSEPASAEEINRMCPDCPSLLALNDSNGLDSIKAALNKFHEDTNETNYFKLLEVGRISTQWMFLGQSYFAEFAIVETHCSRQEKPEDPHKCKMLGKGEARFGFCKSTLLGNGEISADCDIYEAQTDHHRHHHYHFHHKGSHEWRHGPHSHGGPPPHPGQPPKLPDGQPGHPHGPPPHPHGLPGPPHGTPGHHDSPHKPPKEGIKGHHHPHICGMPDIKSEKIHPIRPYPLPGCHLFSPGSSTLPMLAGPVRLPN
ncbi:alpha-2-HS-glycoprotein-like [Arapaima gigas]